MPESEAWSVVTLLARPVGTADAEIKARSAENPELSSSKLLFFISCPE